MSEYIEQLREQIKQLENQCKTVKKSCSQLSKIYKKMHQKRNRKYLSPDVYVREYDSSTYINVDSVNSDISNGAVC